MQIASDQVEAIRKFSRFYTSTILALGDAYLESPFNVSEARVIYELAHGDEMTAQNLSKITGLDPGYLSRLLKSFEIRGYITRQVSPDDGRRMLISITEAGKKSFQQLDEASKVLTAKILQRLSESDRLKLIDAVQSVQALITGEKDNHRTSYILREHQPGDMGWIISAHGRIYAEEFGWDETFEIMVAEIAANFLKNYDAKWERCWIAEMAGENVGSAMVVKQADGIAKLRLVIIDPKARGLGIGKRLVEEAIRFAKRKNYHTMTLWTNSVLLAARSIYEDFGFTLLESESYQGFGQELVGENWLLDLKR